MENIKIAEDKLISNIIAIINYNQKNYCIYNEKGKIKYAILNDNKFEFDIDVETIEVLNKFYNLIRYNKEYGVFCGNYKLNNNEFEIYQDLRSKLYTFILIKSNKRYIPSREDTIMLNHYFNREQFVFYNENQKKDIRKTNKPLKFLKKVLTIGTISVTALISATILTYNLPQDVKSDIDYKLGTTFRKDLTQADKSYTFEDLKTAIDQNEYISERDKWFIKTFLEDEFEENKEYMNIPEVIKRLKTLRIQYDRYFKYNKKTGEYELTHEDISSDIDAWYNVLTNEIKFLEPSYVRSQIEEKKYESFGFDEVDKGTYFHEVNHILTGNGVDSALSKLAEQMSFLEVNDYIRSKTGIFEAVSDDMQKNCNTSIFREAINEIFAQEYIDKYYQQTQYEKSDSGYSEDLPYMYCLAEILPTEVLREYKFNDDDSIITEGLINISDNKSEAYKLMTSLKSLGLYDNLISRAETNNNINADIENGGFLLSADATKVHTEKIEQAKQEKAENCKRIHDGFAYFYKARYNKEMSDDMNMLIYLYNTPVLTDEERQKVIEYLNLSTKNPNIKFVAKGYFSKDYIETHPYISVTYENKNRNSKTITISDNNRYLESKPDIER